MRLYTHVLTDTERVRDLEGQNYASLVHALRDARRTALALIAEHLPSQESRCLDWKLHVADEDDIVLAVVAFSDVIKSQIPTQTQGKEPEPTCLYVTHRKARSNVDEIHHNLASIWNNLRTLGKLTSGLESS